MNIHSFYILDASSPNYSLTEEILKCIGKHISANRKVSKEEFQVCISQNKKTTYSPESYVTIDQHFKIFPNPKKRKEADKELMIVHVFRDHFYDITLSYQNGKIIVNDLLAPGTYNYKFCGKRRRWVRESLSNM